MSIFDVIERIDEQKLIPFMAPIPDPEVTTLFTVQDNIPYWINVTDGRSGWWWVKSDDKKTGTLTHMAEAYEYLEYLDQLPRFHVIVLYEVGENYLVIPYNASDAAQRGWLNSSPRFMYLPRNILLEPYTVVEARELSRVLLYHSQSLIPRLSTTPKSSQFDVAIGLVQRYERKKDELLTKAQMARARVDAEGKLKFDLSLSGASLDNFTETGEGFEVTWTYDGATFTRPVSREGRILSPGICLQGRHQEHNLASIVHVMQKARELHRYDLDERLWK